MIFFGVTLIMYILRSIGADPGFQVRGAQLKKLRRAEGRAKNFGVFCVKNHDFTPKKNHIFEKMNYEKLQFEREIIDVVRSSYI
jgi:hypothetical protein